MHHSEHANGLLLAGLLLMLAVAGGIAAAAILLPGPTQNRAYAQQATNTPPPPPTSTPRPTPVPQCEFLVGTSGIRGKLRTSPMEFAGAQGSDDFRPVEPDADGHFAAVNIYGSAPCHWTATPNVDWITLHQSSGIVHPDQAHENLRFRINSAAARKLPPGTHKGQINFSVAAGDLGPVSTLYIDLYLLGPCQFAVQTDFLRFDMQAGDDPDAVPPLPIVISNTVQQAGDCIWQASPSKEWLRVTPGRGRLAGGQSNSLSINPTGAVSALQPRDTDYAFSVQFTTENGISRSVSGALHIEPAPCRLELALTQNEFEISGPQEGPFTPDSIRVRIRNTGGRPCHWHTSDGRWFHTKALGGTLDPLDTGWFEVQVSESARTAPPGEHNDRITVNSGISGGNAEVPLKLNVSPLPCQFTAQASQELDFRRNTDGSFTAPKTIEIRNAAHRQNCQWGIVPPPWLSVTPAAGVLSGGATAVLQIAVASEIAAAAMEPHRVHNGVISIIGQSEIPNDLQFKATLEMGCVDTEPCIEIHSSRKEITYGEKATVTLTARNPLNRRELTVNLTLELPDGWELSPGDFGSDCSGSECSTKEKVDPGGTKEIEFEASPSAPSSKDRESVFTGNVSYFYDVAAPRSYRISIPITVNKASEGIIASYRATSTPAPTATAPAVEPTPGGSPPVPAPGQSPDAGAAATAPFWQDWRVWALSLALVSVAAVIVFFLLINGNGAKSRKRRSRPRRRRSQRQAQRQQQPQWWQRRPRWWPRRRSRQTGETAS